MITAELRGAPEVIAKLKRLPTTVRASLAQKVFVLAIMLQTYIRQEKLSGQVLNVISGNLRRSIQQVVINEPTKVIGRVYSSGDVKYAAIHEYGGKTAAHVIEPKKGEALAFILGGKEVFFKRVNHPGSVIPERSFMRSSLKDKTVEIQMGLKEAVVRGLAQATAGG